MHALRSIIVARRTLLALYALAVATLGFAHKPASVTKLLDAAAYTLPDGSVAVLCVANGTNGGGNNGAHVSAYCAACLLSGAPGILPPDYLAKAAPPQLLLRAATPHLGVHVIACRQAHAQARAPPGVASV